MNWKFWTWKVWGSWNSPLRTNVQLFDPAWPEKRRVFLERLGNTVETDPLMTGMLGLIEQEILLQVQKCERPDLTDAEAHSLCGRIGLLSGLRADLGRQWRIERTKQQAKG